MTQPISAYTGGDPGADPAHEWKHHTQASEIAADAPGEGSGSHRLTVTRTTSSTVVQSGSVADAVRRRCDRLRETGTAATVAESLDGYVVRFAEVDGARVVLTYQEGK